MFDTMFLCLTMILTFYNRFMGIFWMLLLKCVVAVQNSLVCLSFTIKQLKPLLFKDQL